jgi:hypothetical protein
LITAGGCAKTAEENDPEAIDASGFAADAIEPMSSGRLAMYQGADSSGTYVGTGYFLDPSCAYGVTTPALCTPAGASKASGAATGASGATTITMSSTTNTITVGQVVTGTGIGTNATVVSVSGTSPTQTVTLSVANSAAVSGTVTFSLGNVLAPNVTYQAGSSYASTPGSNAIVPTLTASGSSTLVLSGQTGSTPLVVGQIVVYDTKITPGTTIASVSGTFPNQTITLSAPTIGAITANASITFSSSGAFSVVRSMYIYFRDADVNSTTIFQPGGTRNWVRTLFYNPCSGTTPANVVISVANGNCTGGGLYGPGGAPEIAKTGTQALVSSSGIAPAYSATVGGP